MAGLELQGITLVFPSTRRFQAQDPHTMHRKHQDAQNIARREICADACSQPIQFVGVLYLEDGIPGLVSSE